MTTTVPRMWGYRRDGRRHSEEHTIIDFLFSKDGLRIDHVEVSLSGVRLGRSRGSGLSPETAVSVEGSVRLALADLTTALSRPELLDQLLTGLGGLARPDIAFTDGADGGVRITGSIEIMGRRFPVTASSRLSIVDDRVVVSFTQLDGLPMLAALSSKLPSLALPLTLPDGLHFTTVGTAPGAIVIGFAGTDVPLGSGAARPGPDTGLDSA